MRNKILKYFYLLKGLTVSEEKLKIGSEIFRDIAQVFFATMFIGVLMNGSNLILAISGLILSIIIWILSLIIIK